jgi:hypothetical protein
MFNEITDFVLLDLFGDQGYIDSKTGLEYYPAWCVHVVLVATALSILGLVWS